MEGVHMQLALCIHTTIVRAALICVTCLLLGRFVGHIMHAPV